MILERWKELENVKNGPRTPEESAASRAWAISSLQNLAREMHTVKLAYTDIQNDPRSPSVRELGIEFETVKKAIRAAGLYPVCPEAEDLIRSLKEFYAKYGVMPHMSDANEGQLPYSASAYVSAFGSWNAALRAAGLDPIMPTGGKKRRTIKCRERDEEMLLYLKDKYGETGILPSRRRHDASNPTYTSRQYRHIGGWGEIAAKLNLKMEATSIVHAKFSNKPTPPQQTNEKVAV